MKPEYDESHENNTNPEAEKTIFSKASTIGLSQPESVKALPMVNQKEQPQDQDSEQRNEKETPTQDINPFEKDNDAVQPINENGDGNVDQQKLPNVPQGRYFILLLFNDFI